MNVVFFTSGHTGSGRIVRAISLALAFKRKGFDVDYTILSSSQFAHLSDRMGVKHLEITAEDENRLSKSAWPESELYKSLRALSPDVLVIDLLWFPIHNFARELRFKKIFLWYPVDPSFFSIPLPSGTIAYNPALFDTVVAIEPYKGDGPEIKVNPLVIRNREEILPRDNAARLLGLDESKKACLIAINAHPGDFEAIAGRYAHLENEGYQLVQTTNYKGGIFPAADYFNAFDLVVCTAGYNSFWETRFFGKKAEYIVPKTRFMDGGIYLRYWMDYTFEVNGADQLAEMIYSG